MHLTPCVPTYRQLAFAWYHSLFSPLPLDLIVPAKPILRKARNPLILKPVFEPNTKLTSSIIPARPPAPQLDSARALPPCRGDNGAEGHEFGPMDIV